LSETLLFWNPLVLVAVIWNASVDWSVPVVPDTLEPLPRIPPLKVRLVPMPKLLLTEVVVPSILFWSNSAVLAFPGGAYSKVNTSELGEKLALPLHVAYATWHRAIAAYSAAPHTFFETSGSAKQAASFALAVAMH
jgi:hypothetical protein